MKMIYQILQNLIEIHKSLLYLATNIYIYITQVTFFSVGFVLLKF